MLQIVSVQVVRCGLVSRLVLPLLFSTTLASAQGAAPDCPEQDATVCGRHHFEVGTQAFEKGDFASAAAEFQAALAQRPHSVIRFNLALSLARLGHPGAAIEQLKLVQADEDADKELRERATKEEHSAELAQSRVTFRLSDPTRERVEVDGAAVSLAPEGELALDPGTHHVRVISGSSVVLDQELELSPSERVELRVGERSRRIDVVVVPEATPKKVVPELTVPEHSSAKLSPVYFYVGAGATLALTGSTVWSGFATKSALSDYDRDLPGLTQTRADARVAHGHSLERRTNLLLAGSLVCGAGTAVLGIWLVDFSGKRQVSFGFLPSSVALSGRF